MFCASSHAAPMPRAAQTRASFASLPDEVVVQGVLPHVLATNSLLPFSQVSARTREQAIAAADFVLHHSTRTLTINAHRARGDAPLLEDIFGTPTVRRSTTMLQHLITARRERDSSPLNRWVLTQQRAGNEKAYRQARALEDFHQNDTQTLDFSWSRISELPPGMSQLDGLRTLELHESGLKTLPEDIGDLQQLCTLWAWNTRISSLPADFARLSQLKDLLLQDNRLGPRIPMAIFSLRQLSCLDLQNCGIENVSGAIGQLSALTYLDLCKNRIDELPDSIGSLSQLMTLKLWRNRIVRLPESINKLTRLKELKVSANRLRNLPETIGRLAQLQVLEASGNSLEALPDDIGALSSLTDLNLARNQIRSLPASVGNLRNLKVLYLTFNRLQTLEPSIADLPQLKVLYIEGNHGLHIPLWLRARLWSDCIFPFSKKPTLQTDL